MDAEASTSNEFVETVNGGLKIIQKKNSLLFGTDALLLAAYMRKCKGTAYEFGGGSGIISLLAMQRKKFSKIRVFEVQNELAQMIGRNIVLNGMEDSIDVAALDIRNIKDEYPDDYADVVFSNPPYMSCGCGKKNENEMKYLSRHEVCGDIGDFCESAAAVLKYGGLFYCVYREDRTADLICALRDSKLEPKRITFVHDRTNCRPSMLLLEAKKGAAPGLFITEPLILKNSEGYTTEARYIFDNGEFNERFTKR